MYAVHTMHRHKPGFVRDLLLVYGAVVFFGHDRSFCDCLCYQIVVLRNSEAFVAVFFVFMSVLVRYTGEHSDLSIECTEVH